MAKPLIAPRRRGIQWLVSLCLLLAPFVSVGGAPLLRLDAPARTLYLLFVPVRITEFHLVLLATLLLVFGFLFVTMVFGRVWCGWLCPQTTLSDLADRAESRIASAVGNGQVATVLRHLFYLVVSLVVSSNLIWYFMSPAAFVHRIVTGSPGMPAGISLVTVALLVYLDLAWVRRSFCRHVCPYGRIQLMAMDRNTLTLEFDRMRQGGCLRCGACVAACPTGIDIRDGLQVECINCGRCLDACRGVMAGRDRDGLIRYRFGSGTEGAGSVLNGRTVLLGTALITAFVLLVVAVSTRPAATLAVRHAAARSAAGTAGGRVEFFTVYLENRSDTPAVFDLAARYRSGEPVRLLGPVHHIAVPANENRRIDCALQYGADDRRRDLEFVLHRAGAVVATAPAVLTGD